MSPRRRRNTLSRTAVLDATLALIDRVGVDGLTVRGLAHALGRPPMSLYAHFDSKATLLDLAFGHLVHRLLRAHRHATWQAELEAACRHMRHELIRHPHWVGLLTRVSVPPSALHGYDRLLGLMAQDGLRPEAAMFALSSIVAHALGAVLTERLLDGTPPVPAQRFRLVRAMIAQLPAAPSRASTRCRRASSGGPSSGCSRSGCGRSCGGWTSPPLDGAVEGRQVRAQRPRA